MAQEMYEENKVLESEIESLKSLLNDIDDFLRDCNPQSSKKIEELETCKSVSKVLTKIARTKIARTKIARMKILNENTKLKV